MVLITVHLTPPVTGAKSKLFLVIGQDIHPIIDLPLSTNGVIEASIGISSPQLDYVIILQEQTIEGVAYFGARSAMFNLVSDVTLNMILTPVSPEPPPPPPPPPPVPPVEYGNIVVPTIVGVLALLAAIRL